jgi:hypothetical protein
MSELKYTEEEFQAKYNTLKANFSSRYDNLVKNVSKKIEKETLVKYKTYLDAENDYIIELNQRIHNQRIELANLNRLLKKSKEV